MRVLVVEDDEHIASHIVRALQGANMMVTHLANGSHASSELERCRRANSRFDAVVLDLTLPGMDGIDLLRRMRANNDATSVLVLTARGSLSDRVTGLELGADDYLAKPFEPAELIARLRVLGRRAQTTTEVVKEVGNLSFDAARGTFMIEGRPINLTRKSSILLQALFKRQGSTVPHDFLMGLGDEAMSQEAVMVHVSRARKVLQENGSNVSIKSIHGVGYSLVAGPAE